MLAPGMKSRFPSTGWASGRGAPGTRSAASLSDSREPGRSNQLGWAGSPSVVRTQESEVNRRTAAESQDQGTGAASSGAATSGGPEEPQPSLRSGAGTPVV